MTEVSSKDPRATVDTAIAAIIRDIKDRSGLGNAWDEIDVDVRNEIIATWRSIIIIAVEHPHG